MPPLHHSNMHHSQTRPKPTATSNSSSLCHSRPSCSSRHATVVLSCKASSAPAAQYEPVPAVRGGLPYIGVLHRTPVNQVRSSGNMQLLLGEAAHAAVTHHVACKTLAECCKCQHAGTLHTGHPLLTESLHMACMHCVKLMGDGLMQCAQQP